MSQNLRDLYARIAPRYERVNHAFTLGLDMLWRRQAARTAVEGGGELWLDVCCGTGEMTGLLRRFGRPGPTIVGADFSPEMLELASSRAREAEVLLTAADAARLPFPDGCFDLVTISFASRNVATAPGGLMPALREFHRVLQPGGRFVNLETSQPPCAIIRGLFKLYVGTAVVPIARLLSGNRPAYTYLVRSTCRFHGAEEFSTLLAEAGFSDVTFRRLLLGAAAIHVGVKRG